MSLLKNCIIFGTIIAINNILVLFNFFWMINDNWYLINDVEMLDTPALAIYPDRVNNNVLLLKGMIDDVSRLRPHAKTNKSKEATQILLDNGIIKFKCATIAEAEMLGMCNAPDVLLAYQPYGPKIERLMRVIKTYPKTKFSCLVDNFKTLIEISTQAVSNNVDVGIFVDINVGQNRTGLMPDNSVLQLYIDCMNLPRVKPIGFHVYDGHINQPDLAERTRLVDAYFEVIKTLQTDLRSIGYPIPVILAGGTTTFAIHSQKPDIECSPGTFIYWDYNYQNLFKELPFLPAALVIARVISLPDKTKICLDLGHKSIASENDLNKRVYFLNAPNLKLISHSEEHLVADAGANHSFKIGDVLYGVPFHICPTIALYDKAATIVENKINGEWENIARKRKITI